MTRYDVVVIGAGLGGLTAGAILARQGQKILVIERSNSVGGAASSYKVGDLFVEGSLHETSDPRNPHDPKHDILTRAGVLDTVTWSPSDTFYEVRGGPIGAPLQLPANFNGVLTALSERFPGARAGIEQIIAEIETATVSKDDLSIKAFLSRPIETIRTAVDTMPFASEWPLSLQDKLDRVFGGNEAVKCALAANLAYYHDDPKTLWWIYFAMAQGQYLTSGPCYIKGGSQRLSSALARSIKAAGGDIVLRRTVSAVDPQPDGSHMVTHTAKDGSGPQTIEASRIISNAAPEATASLLPDAVGAALRKHYAAMTPSISLFALTLGLSRPPRDVGFTSYSTQLLPPSMTRLAGYSEGSTLMASEPGEQMPPMAIVDYAAIDSGIAPPPYVLSIFGPDRLSNWDGSDMDLYRAKRARWQDAMIRYLDREYPGLAGAIVASSFNTALSTKQYLNAPDGAVYGFAPTTPGTFSDGFLRSPRTPVPELYLSSAYANFGGFTGVIQAAGACADMILRET
jgi:phytoene dehydrogenase-like protein